MTEVSPPPRGAHLVGSVPLDTADAVFRTVAVSLGDRLRRIPDGETGERALFAGWQVATFARHPDFEVEDHNLIYEADLAPWEAVLGANISVPTLAGRVNIKIPPGTQNELKLRLRGRGLPTPDSGRGDLIVVARIAVPPRVTEEERKLWEKLARESHFKPRE